jgi:hypothetical protein
MGRAAVHSWLQDCGSAVGIGLHFGIYVGSALFFYWLMQPTVYKNPGLAAYKPPPMTVMVYADSPWVPGAQSEPPSILAQAQPAPAVAESVVVAPKKEIKARE